MNDNYYDIAIIGGGAAGLMLAANLDLHGQSGSGIILERSARPGSKILMSGGGHCNITHGGSIKDFVYAYGRSGHALRRCLYRHSNLELARWFYDRGVPLTDESGKKVELAYGSAGLDNDGRIFPESMRSKDVLDALLREVDLNGWQIETEAKICGLRSIVGYADGPETCDNCPEYGSDPDGRGVDAVNAIWELTLENEYEITAGTVVTASGGITYPETGSDGSMLGLLGDLGLGIDEPRPALAPVYVENYPYPDLAGVSVPDVTVVAFRSDSAVGRKSESMRGDILFTHEGLSGPAILNISKYVEPGEKIRLCYNKELPELPRRMQKILRDRARGPLGDVRTGVLASLLDHDDFIVDHVDERGMVTAGGVSLGEVDLKTMQTKKFGNLYVIGEVLDADGITGGYNLQMCWSTACTAADSLRRL